ncbi:cytochrome c [Acidiphilium sp. AL]|uniref:Cytochrome c n=1 Tax=Acidiphilium iwatense TaxID=768198 RepID=A0ABS9E308_9PROT|nr:MULTISPECIES: cytochrome c [Acidiphilium]MCF3948708.1 cytochrome c [Acidiphilium iwatense]MCU4161369.1 cytochrome c [Acidiphilium sp. AL]
MKQFAAPAIVVATLALFATAHAAAPPALYTQAQATSGRADFETHCSMCHGKNLQGISGPALVGQNFAGPSNNYTVAAIFDELSQQMPAGAPGSLTKAQYTDIMAFILSKNGYPAGKTALTYDGAQSSTVKLVSRVK